MVEEIKELEKIAKQLEPDEEIRIDWLQQVDRYAQHFLTHVNKLPAWVESTNKSKELLHVKITENPTALADLLHLIGEYVDKPGLNPASGGHLAYIPGGGIYPAALGDYLADITNRYAGLFYPSPGAVRIENQLIRWMCQLVGFPEDALGNLTSGGSIASLIAIATARDAKNISAAKIDKSVIYLTEQVHHSIQKAIRISGLSEAVIRYIPVDDRFKMRADLFEKQLLLDVESGLIPFLLVASVGTTDTGAIDPLPMLLKTAQKHNLWVHADAAYGGFFTLIDELQEKFEGLSDVDSITIDPHKGLFLPYGLGAVLVKNVEALKNTHYYKANYMQDAMEDVQEPSPADLSPELTKHFRGLRMWLPLQLLGTKPFKAALKEKILLAQYFYHKIQNLGFQTGPFPELSVLIFRYLPEEGEANYFNATLIEAVKEDGRVFLSSTTINGVFWIRLAVLSFRTHLQTIDTCLEVLQKSLPLVQAALNSRLV